MGKNKTLAIKCTRTATILILLTALAGTAFAGRVVYVDADATGANNGTSWSDAYTNLQFALDEAITDDEIRVAEGVYRPTTAGGDREVSFSINCRLALLGGFAGSGATDPDAREFELYRTVLSGDLNGDDAAVDDPGELAGEPTRAENSYHVLKVPDYKYGTGTVVEGFVITGGNANGEIYTQRSGGGVEGRGRVTIRYCVIEGNSSAVQGGGCASTGPLYACVIRNNHSVYGGGLSRPGALRGCVIEQNSASVGGGVHEPTHGSIWRDCVIRDNSAAVGGGVAMGNEVLAPVGCVFSGNHAWENGGGIYIMSDCTCVSELWMYQCRLWGNSAGSSGGAMYQAGNPMSYLYSTMVWGNQADSDGGGLFCNLYEGMRDEGNCSIVNCTFASNTAGNLGGAVNCQTEAGDWFQVANSILWGNRDKSGAGTEEAQIRSSESTVGTGTGDPGSEPPDTVRVRIDYCCIEGWTGELGGSGNTGSEPMFVDADGADDIAGNEDDDMHLLRGSSLIDGGDSSRSWSAPGEDCETWWEFEGGSCGEAFLDLDGGARVFGVGPDVGAYEMQYEGPRTIYVDDDAAADPGPGDPCASDPHEDGSAAHPFDAIQEAIEAAGTGDTVIVARGTYVENIKFGGRNITLRSSNPDDEDVVAGTIIDGNRADSVVTFSGTEDERCVLSGFTIQNGFQDYDTTKGGGGICGGSEHNHTGATIRKNRIIRNFAWDGGGVSLCDGLIERNTITGNTARWWVGGGGLYECNGIVRNNLIVGNMSGGCESGGGLSHCNGTIENNIIAENSTDGCGAVVSCGGEIRNCIIWANRPRERAQLDQSSVPLYSCIEGWTGQPSETGNMGQDPCFAEAGYWDPNGTADETRDDFLVMGDYHLKSQAGRWDPVARSWVQDEVTSPCIDTGDPASLIGLEPFPNGGIVNMGAYGGTTEASKSYFGRPVCKKIAAGDINGDCKVNFGDFCIMALHWLEHNNP